MVPDAVDAARRDADGKRDLAVANCYGSNVGVLLGNGAGGFAAAVTYASGGSYPISVTVGDFNSDGKSDLAVSNYSSNDIGILLGDGAGGSQPAPEAEPQSPEDDGDVAEATMEEVHLVREGQPHVVERQGEGNEPCNDCNPAKAAPQ